MTWLPLIAAVLGAAVLVVGLDVWGIGRRVAPRGQAFLTALPRPLRRLWALTLAVIVVEVAMTAFLYDKGPDWWSFATQVWTVSAPLVGLCLLVIAIGGMVVSAMHTRRRERVRPPDSPPQERVDVAAAIGAASGRALRSSPTARALVGHGDRLLRAARAGLDAARTDDRPD